MAFAEEVPVQKKAEELFEEKSEAFKSQFKMSKTEANARKL